MRLPLLFLLIAASATCFYATFRSADSLTYKIQMVRNGTVDILTTSAGIIATTPWIAATETVDFTVVNYGDQIWARLSPGPLLPPLLTLTTTYAMGVNVPTSSDRLKLTVAPAGVLYPIFTCELDASCACNTLLLSDYSVNKSAIALFTTDYAFSISG